MDEKQESLPQDALADIHPADEPLSHVIVSAENPKPDISPFFASLRAFLEIFLCSGIPTSLIAVFTLRLLDVSNEEILTSPFHLACMVGIEACLLLLLILRLQKMRGKRIGDLGWRRHDLYRETRVGLGLVPLLLLSNLFIGFFLEKFLPQWRSESNPMLELIDSPEDLLIFFSLLFSPVPLKKRYNVPSFFNGSGMNCERHYWVWSFGV